jgi:hypothetical protein
MLLKQLPVGRLALTTDRQSAKYLRSPLLLSDGALNPQIERHCTHRRRVYLHAVQTLEYLYYCLQAVLTFRLLPEQEWFVPQASK